MTTIHIVFHAHIDPIWLWPWQAGLDEVLNTCRIACNLLDTEKDLIFTQGEAWAYRQVERVDEELFERIKGHVRGGRWEIVGGWWIQPDCNFPSGFGFERQIELGKAYFLDRFGFSPRVAYNEDSFGHAAALPGYMRAVGQECYVMMRPQEHELPLPARVFRWRGHEGGPEVATFRIARSYNAGLITPEHLHASLTELPEGLSHTMCLAGLGDHGGGPTKRQIEWVRENESIIDGCRLVISSPSRFFEAISDGIPSLPLVTGELQHHAIGCYSVTRSVKVGVRRAEHLLRQAEVMNEANLQEEGQAREKIRQGWERVCFHHFHDTLGGSCIPSAYEQVSADLGYATSVADEMLHYGLRRMMNELPDDPLQRIVLFNASDAAFDGYTEVEPSMSQGRLSPNLCLMNERGEPIRYQRIHNEALCMGMDRLVFRTRVPAAGLRVVRIERGGQEGTGGTSVEVSGERIANERGVCVLATTPGRLEFPDGRRIALPRLDLIDDLTDTWSHGVDRYPEGPAATARWDAPCVVDSGPVMASLLQTGAVGQSQLCAEWRVYGEEEFVQLRLGIHWSEKLKILKMVLPLPASVSQRIDGIPGGCLERENDGRERPLQDWTMLDLGGGCDLGVVCPDVYALDAEPWQLRFTLLRGAAMSHHLPSSGTAPRAVISDQGEHEFRFRFFCGKGLNEQVLAVQALMLHRPLVMADLTRGMPPRSDL